MCEPLRVLLVEDSADDQVLIERALRKDGLRPSITRVETAEGLAGALRETWDVIIADNRLPALDARQALRILGDSGRDIPFLVVTGTIGEEQASRLLRAGAHDFLLKDRLDRLAPAVEREVREARVRQEHRVAEAELGRARARYRALVEHASDAIFVLSPEGRIVFSSPAAEDLLGLAPEELQGEHALAFVHPEDRGWIAGELAAVMEGDERRRAEYRVVRRDGSVRYVESVATNLFTDPAVEGIVVNTRDLTERRELEEKLNQAQKMEAIGRLVGGIAHDFNNLVTVIGANARMLVDALEECSPEHEDASQVLAAAERAGSLTRQLLAFSRHQALSPRVIDISAVVRDVRKMLERLMGEDVRLTATLPEAPVLVRLDPVQLEQVLMNLAVNARDAMPGGGRVDIYVDAVEAEEVAAGPSVGGVGSWAGIVFRDSGPGIPREIRSRIFEPFFTTKATGTGLGLSTVYGIVAQSGGRVRVECPAEGGTMFVITFPRLGEAQARVHRADGAGPRPLRLVPAEPADDVADEAGRILVVDDNPEVRRVTHRVLTRAGFSVTAVTCGREALEAMREAGPFQVLVTDLVMPEMPGEALARRIAELQPGMPILYMSGNACNLPPDHRAGTGRRGFLEKPFTPDQLGRAVRDLLQKPA